jgi:hypothetical protein
MEDRMNANNSNANLGPTSNSSSLEHQLRLIVMSRIGEDQITWTIFSIFWAAQVILAGALFQGSFPPHPVVGIAVSFIGVAMSLAWAFTQQRALLHLEQYENVTKVIEQELIGKGILSVEHQITIGRRFPGPRARDVMRSCCWGAFVVWVLSSLLFIGYASSLWCLAINEKCPLLAK